MKKVPVILFFILLILLSFVQAFAQEQYGHIRGIVVDNEGTPLPGVVVVLESELYASRSVSTSQNGIFRFINITPGICSLKCEIPGFKLHVQENIDIRIGTNYEFEIELEILKPA